MFRPSSPEIEDFIATHCFLDDNARRLRDWKTLRSAFYGVNLNDLIYLIPRLAGLIERNQENAKKYDEFWEMVTANDNAYNRFIFASQTYDDAYNLAKGEDPDGPEAEARRMAREAYLSSKRDAERSYETTINWLRSTFAYTVNNPGLQDGEED